ncbi:MAG: hypothetical protein QOD85_1585, partial [Gaiellaceae bacterium]|nr:hypothetical protein [Gaiellaceae bacterium]
MSKIRFGRLSQDVLREAAGCQVAGGTAPDAPTHDDPPSTLKHRLERTNGRSNYLRCKPTSHKIVANRRN